MKTERKYWFALATLFLIFTGVAAAATYEIKLDPKVPVTGSTLTVTVLKDGNNEAGDVVHFFLNKNLPVLTITDAQGKARFMPLIDGDLDINVTTQDGFLLASWHQSIEEILPIDPAGNITAEKIIESSNDDVTITIPIGTNAVDIDGFPLTNVSVFVTTNISTNAAAALGNDKIPGGFEVELKPEGARFNPPIQIRFNYTDAQLTAAGITESTLKVKFFNNSANKWEDQATYVLNTSGNYIIANISHFSTFAIVGTPASNPPGTSGSSGTTPTTTSTPKPTTTAAAPSETVVPQTSQPPGTTAPTAVPSGEEETAGTTSTGFWAGLLGLGIPVGGTSVSIWWIVGLIAVLSIIYIFGRKTILDMLKPRKP